MSRGIAQALIMLLLLAGGCHTDKPHEYGQQNPDLGDRDPRERGPGSKDLEAATDQMAQDLLADPALNASKNQWTIVVMNMENQTRDRVDYDIFLGRLKTKLAKHGRGRITLYENLARFKEMRSRELEGTVRDRFGQGGSGAAPAATEQPDYGLYGKVQALEGRGIATWRFEFTITNFSNRRQVWTNDYVVKLER